MHKRREAKIAERGLTILVPYDTILKSGREDRTTLWYVASTSLEMGLLLYVIR